MPPGGGSGGPHYSVFRLLLISLPFRIEPYRPQPCRIPRVRLQDSKRHKISTVRQLLPAGQRVRIILAPVLKRKQHMPPTSSGSEVIKAKGYKPCVHPRESLMMKAPKQHPCIKTHSASYCREVIAHWDESSLVDFLTPTNVHAYLLTWSEQIRGGSALPGINFLSSVQPCHCPGLLCLPAVLSLPHGESHTHANEVKSSGVCISSIILMR